MLHAQHPRRETSEQSPGPLAQRKFFPQARAFHSLPDPQTNGRAVGFAFVFCAKSARVQRPILAASGRRRKKDRRRMSSRLRRDFVGRLTEGKRHGVEKGRFSGHAVDVEIVHFLDEVNHR